MSSTREEIKHQIVETRSVLACRKGEVILIVAQMADKSILVHQIETVGKTMASEFTHPSFVDAVISQMEEFAPLAKWCRSQGKVP